MIRKEKISEDANL
jgi:hypothetical protein